MAFGEQILDIADDSRNDWLTAKTGRQIPNKELVLRSKLRIEAREFHMSRLHPQTWGDRQKIDLKSDWSLLTEEERLRKAERAAHHDRGNPQPTTWTAAPRLSSRRAPRRR
jgi:Bacteriophage Sf6, terminase small subunit-like